MSAAQKQRGGIDVRALSRAERLIARIDRMPGTQSARAMATDQAQAALELIGRANRQQRAKDVQR